MGVKSGRRLPCKENQKCCLRSGASHQWNTKPNRATSSRSVVPMTKVGRFGEVEVSSQELSVISEPEAHVLRHKEGVDTHVVTPISTDASQLDATETNRVADMKRAIQLTTLSVFVISTTAGIAQAYECKPFRTQLSATKNLKTKAKRQARANWQSNIRTRFGLPWSLWQHAKGKRINCRKADQKWTCHAVAKACKWVPAS